MAFGNGIRRDARPMGITPREAFRMPPHAILLGYGSAALDLTIVGIVTTCAKEQVIRITARGIVAAMQDTEITCWSFAEFPRNTVRIVLSSLKPHGPIPFGITSAFPRPTA